ncbi:FAD/NAD(P)-binding protein [Streptomyces sp. L2]|uniref:FAD/NAD(P)-binding protein n=1 Tax=Streptomyces sp. L2 TaxID=2162665 RepID=UPI001F510196|nr:FAD/NAD(P)-binding protein [Streptomyces sp. L2]
MTTTEVVTTTEGPSPTPAPASVVIIGAGSRGLGLLERLISHTLAHPFPLVVHLVDPGLPGPGFHRADDPDHLLLNTVCAQLTAFADTDMVDGPAPLSGPSLHTWCLERDLRLDEDGFTVRPGRGRQIRPNDFLPRRLLSEYLTWAAQRITEAAPDCLTLVRHATTATDVLSGDSDGAAGDADRATGDPAGAAGDADGAAGDARETVVLADGGRITADAVFVTVGHHSLHVPPPPADAPRSIGRPYPLPDAVESVAPGDRVAVLGTGLTAMDVIATLTVGRGGRHVRDGERLRYERGGREPLIVLANRSGLPARSRPHLNPGRIRPVPIALTEQRLAALRAQRPDGRLRFTKDVLPLVVAEMELAWYRTLLARALGGRPADAERAAAELADDARESGFERQLDALRARFGPAPVRDLLTGTATPPADATEAPARSWPGPDDYAAHFTTAIEDDLAEARAGLGVSPLKEALEVLRDHRDILRAAVDAPGLDEESSAYFFGTFAPLVNRLVIGPQLDRSAELLSLLDAGVVRLGPGPAPKVVPPSGGGPWRLESTLLEQHTAVEVDHVVHAHVAEPAAELVTGSLLRRLVRAGRARTRTAGRANLPGLDVNRQGQGICRTGAVQPRLFFLGPHTEGSSYYNHYVPSPGAPSRALKDAELALTTALPELTGHQTDTGHRTDSAHRTDSGHPATGHRTTGRPATDRRPTETDKRNR